jgi:diguanylate cyclase (GGDEF)-like protein
MSAAGTPVVGLDGEFVSLVSTLSDVDVLVHTTEELAEQRLRLRVTLDSLLDPHVILSALRDDAGQIVDFTYAEANRAACEYMRMPPDQLIGARLRDLLPGVAASGMLASYIRAVETGEPLILNDEEYDHEILDDRRYFDVRAIKVGDGLSFTWRDVTDRHAFELRLNALAKRDPLTGLVNRTELLDRIVQAAEVARAAGMSIAVALIDLDHFKDINDTLGHEAGDDLLKSVARRIEGAVKKGDVVARIGGDEFVVLIRGVKEPTDAVQCVDRVLSALRVPFRVGGNTFFSSGSAGVAVSASESLLGEGEGRVLLREADTALYDAKAAGRDRWAFFTERLRTAVAGRVTVVNDLRKALVNGELTVWYQPEVDLATGKVRAVEALLRWNHPAGDVWPADRFIEVAEDSGLIFDIGAHVITQTFSEAASIVSLRPDDPVTVRINLSAAQLSSGNLISQIDDALRISDADPRHLCMEITESAATRDVPQVKSNLDALMARGFSIAIDDFGVGFASLAYLRDFRCQLIKIDRSFLCAPGDPGRSRRLIRALVALAVELDIGVTAEGVETMEQAAFLRGIGCHSGQGYLFAPAVPIPTLAPLLARGFAGSGGCSDV